MDKQLLENYAAAVRVRPLLKLLPDGLSQYCLQYERMLLADIRAQSGNPNLTETEILQQVETTTDKLLKQLLPIIGQIIITFMQKKWPTAAATSFVSAALTYLAAKWGG